MKNDTTTKTKSISFQCRFTYAESEKDYETDSRKQT